MRIKFLFVLKHVSRTSYTGHVTREQEKLTEDYFSHIANPAGSFKLFLKRSLFRDLTSTLLPRSSWRSLIFLTFVKFISSIYLPKECTIRPENLTRRTQSTNRIQQINKQNGFLKNEILKESM